MNARIWLPGIILCIIIVACASGKVGRPTEIWTTCPDGKRQILDCQMAFDQFARTVKADLGVVQSFGAGFGLGAQKLISLDSINGDLLAHSRQICIDYNNCLLNIEEYKRERRYLLRAQYKIRLAAYWASVGSGSIAADQEAPSPPGIADIEEFKWAMAGYQGSSTEAQETSSPTEEVTEEAYTKNESFKDESKHTVLNELDELNKEIKKVAAKKESQKTISREAKGGVSKSVRLEYSIIARRKISGTGKLKSEFKKINFQPGVKLISGDQFKIQFVTDGDGYVYILNFDSSGKAQIIFPHPDIALDNKVTAGRRYEVPGPNDWYYLDDVTGKETLYLIAVPFPIRNLDKLVSELRRGESGINSRVQTARLRGALNALTERGVGGIVKEDSEKHGMTSIKINDYHQ